MFPNISRQKRGHAIFQRILGIGALGNLEFAVGFDRQPCPARTEQRGTCFDKSLLERRKRAEIFVDGLTQSTAWFAFGIRSELEKEKDMVPGLSRIVVYGSIRFEQNLLKRFRFERRAGNQVIQVIDIGSFVFTPVELHGTGTDDGFKSIDGIRKSRKFEFHDSICLGLLKECGFFMFWNRAKSVPKPYLCLENQEIYPPMKQIVRIVFIFCVAVAAVGCGSGGEQQRQNSVDSLQPLYEARYAERFELLQDDTEIVLRVKNPWQGADSVTYDYRLVTDTAAPLQQGEIRCPIRRAVCMSSTHVAFLDAVGEVGSVCGVSGLDFITNAAVHAAGVKDVGYDSNLDYETIVALQPDVVFMYGLTGENAAVSKLLQLGVPVVYIADYLENDPLGRAEWIVPFGVMSGKMAEAVAAFMHTENEYNTLGERVAGAVGERPRVMLNAPYKDVWYLPGDRSYMIQLLNDAGGAYLGAGEDTDVSRPVSAERALQLMAEADYWLNPGMVQNMAQLKADNRRFATLPVVRRGAVYNNNARITPMGGSDFWESGAVHPDVVLADMIRILHPELLPEHELFYFHQLK